MCVSKKPLRKDACWAVLGLIKSACVHNVWPVIAERDRRACAHLRLTLRSQLKYCTQILGVTCREEQLDHPFVAGIPCFFTGWGVELPRALPPKHFLLGATDADASRTAIAVLADRAAFSSCPRCFHADWVWPPISQTVPDRCC